MKKDDMNSEEQEIVAKEWWGAEEPDAGSSNDPVVEEAEIQSRMKEYMMETLRWSHKELHDCVVTAGICAPGKPSNVKYLVALHKQVGDDKAGFLLQNWQSHSKQRIQEVLRCFSRTGLKLKTG